MFCRCGFGSVPRGRFERPKQCRRRGAMRLGCLERLGAWGIGALLTFLVHVLLLSQPARASCGALVTSRLDRLQDFNHFDALIVDGSAAPSPVGPAHESGGDQAPAWPKPCSGPSCSNQGPTSASTAAPDTGHLDRWGDLSVRALLTPPPRLHQIVDGPVLHPEGHRPSIFHPPPVPASRPL